MKLFLKQSIKEFIPDISCCKTDFAYSISEFVSILSHHRFLLFNIRDYSRFHYLSFIVCLLFMLFFPLTKPIYNLTNPFSLKYILIGTRVYPPFFICPTSFCNCFLLSRSLIDLFRSWFIRFARNMHLIYENFIIFR